MSATNFKIISVISFLNLFSVYSNIDYKILKEKFPNTEFKLATLFYKKTALIKPDFYIKQTDIWIEFFWEVDIQIKEER